MQETEQFVAGVVKHVDVNDSKAHALWSLATFGIAHTTDKETIKWLSNGELKDFFEIAKPIRDDYLGQHWLVSARRQVTITKSAIRWANPLDFRYSITFVVGGQR
jgi:hypothetical protein